MVALFFCHFLLSSGPILVRITAVIANLGIQEYRFSGLRDGFSTPGFFRGDLRQLES